MLLDSAFFTNKINFFKYVIFTSQYKPFFSGCELFCLINKVLNKPADLHAD